MGIIRRPCLTRASGENLARAPGLHPYSLREVPSAIVMGFLITLLTIFLIGWYGETSRVCSSSSLILHKCKFKKAHWRNVYLHQMCASASMPGGGVRGYSWQWEDSWEANRSTWASPNRLQISWTAWGWSLHSPRRVSCHDWAPPERHVAIWSTPKVECIVTSNKSVSPLMVDVCNRHSAVTSHRDGLGCAGQAPKFHAGNTKDSLNPTTSCMAK